MPAFSWASNRLKNTSTSKWSRLSVELNDSMGPFYHGLPGWINRAVHLASCNSMAVDLAINSPPLSLRKNRGTALVIKSLLRTFLTVFELTRVDTSRAKHSLVNSSTMLKIRSFVPFIQLSWMMSTVQTSFGIVAV